MKTTRKALSMPLELIIGFAVIILIALVIITFTNSSVTKSGNSAQGSQDITSNGIACETQAATWCAQNPGVECSVTDCDKCATAVPCGRLTEGGIIMPTPG